MPSPLEIELEAAGSAPVIVVLKPTAAAAAGAGAAAASLAAADPRDLKEHFLKTAETIGGAIVASLRAAAKAAGGKAAVAAALARIKSPPAMRIFPNLGVVYGTVNEAGYAALKSDKKRVKQILRAPRPSLIRPVAKAAAAAPLDVTWGIKRLNVPDLWDQGITGTGVLVGHLDTGADGSHPALTTAFHACARFDELGIREDIEPADFTDSGDHGTHTAATIAGRPVGASAVGVAPGAKLVSAEVIEGGDVIARILGGMDWALAQQVRILSLSLGLPGYLEDFLPITQIIRSKNILPVFAVGNEGPGTSRSPGNYAEALSVGAIDEDDLVAFFSGSRNFVRDDDPFVPDLVAPGVDVNSAKPGGGFQLMSGTSMATPHIAGLAALLMQAKPEKTATEVEQAIYKSCKRPASMPAARANRGVPDAVKALGHL